MVVVADVRHIDLEETVLLKQEITAVASASATPFTLLLICAINSASSPLERRVLNLSFPMTSFGIILQHEDDNSLRAFSSPTVFWLHND